MDVPETSVTRSKQPWWQTRWPAMYYILSAIWLLFIVTTWLSPGHTVAQEVIGTVIGALLAIVFAGTATLTLVIRRRAR